MDENVGGTPNFASNSERTWWYMHTEQKIMKRRHQKNTWNRKNSTYNGTVEKEREEKSALRKQRRERKRRTDIEIKHYERQRKAEWRAAKQDNTTGTMQIEENVFRHRMERKRAMDRLRSALPETPSKRTAVLAAYLHGASKSPTIMTLQNSNITVSPEERKKHELVDAVLGNIKTVINETKHKRSQEKRTEMNTLLASVSGENISHQKAKVKLTSRLGLSSVKRISRGQRLRTTILTSETTCWEYTKRKTRSDAISTETKETIYKFWMSAGISRPTGNKSDVKRYRIGPKAYISHPLYILEATQTEVYVAFKSQHPNIKVGQRSFEKCKPFFVKPVRPKDKCTCCCRYHVEFCHAFRKCMQIRRQWHGRQSTSDDTKDKFPIFEHSSELVSKTMCRKDENQTFFNKKCLDRSCTTCGINADLFTTEELDESDMADDIEWEKYEYQTLKGKGTATKRKLVLVKKKTKVGVLFKHFQSLLETYPSHQFRAEWQSKQAKSIIGNLPVGDVVAIHDFSENYRCTDRKEIQSSYFQKTEVSLHVTILHRHAILEHDGVGSSVDSPNIIQEQFFVISPDLQHDHHFTYHAQYLLRKYLASISYHLNTIHEFTDGCACQYKSRHCMGSLNTAAKNFNCNIIRNYYETSHAKGPQDAAGGFLKQQAEVSVLRGKTIIQTARDFYNFVSADLKTPKQTAACKGRIFRYVEQVPRDTARYFRPIPSIRTIHQIRSSPSDHLVARQLSCYSCDSCMNKQYLSCESDLIIGSTRVIQLQEEEQGSIEEDQEPEVLPLHELIHGGDIIAVVAIDADYYLFQASSHATVLGTETTDDYRTTYPAGTRVIEGRYFDRAGESLLKYKLLPKHKALVPALSVVYICSEIHPGTVIHIPEIVHLSILSNLEPSL